MSVLLLVGKLGSFLGTGRGRAAGRHGGGSQSDGKDSIARASVGTVNKGVEIERHNAEEGIRHCLVNSLLPRFDEDGVSPLLFPGCAL
jgi:hypothetical protein